MTNWFFFPDMSLLPSLLRFKYIKYCIGKEAPRKIRWKEACILNAFFLSHVKKMAEIY